MKQVTWWKPARNHLSPLPNTTVKWDRAFKQAAAEIAKQEGVSTTALIINLAVRGGNDIARVRTQLLNRANQLGGIYKNENSQSADHR